MSIPSLLLAHDSGRRHLDDEELDSGDDEGREDRIGDEEQGGEHQMEERTKQIQAVELPRMPVPEPSDGEVSLGLVSWPCTVLTQPAISSESTQVSVDSSSRLCAGRV